MNLDIWKGKQHLFLESGVVFVFLWFLLLMPQLLSAKIQSRCFKYQPPNDDGRNTDSRPNHGRSSRDANFQIGSSNWRSCNWAHWLAACRELWRDSRKAADTWVQPQTLRRFDSSAGTTRALSTESTSLLIMHQSVHEKFRPDSAWWDYAILAAQGNISVPTYGIIPPFTAAAHMGK